VFDSDSVEHDITNVQLASVSYIATIGVGGFGRVELVSYAV